MREANKEMREHANMTLDRENASIGVDEGRELAYRGQAVLTKSPPSSLCFWLINPVIHYAYCT